MHPTWPKLVDDQEQLWTLRRQMLQGVAQLDHQDLLVHDFEGRIEQVSAKLCDDLGFSPEQMIGQHISEFTENFKQIFFDEILTHVLIHGSSECHTRYRRRDNSWLPVYIRLTLLDWDQKCRIFCWITPENQTHPPHLHAREQQLESLGRLARGIAHDFNNLLAIIQGNLSLLTPHDEQKEAFQAIEGGINRARQLTQQLLTFSKGGVPSRSLTNVGTLIRDTVLFCLSGSGVEPIFEIPEDLWTCRVDPHQISQVIQNLVLNARDAMKDSGKLFISCANKPDLLIPEAQLPPIDYVEVVIRDTGTGIDPKILPSIFDPYFTTKPHGQGLGLAIAFSILQRHGGTIHCRNQPEGGASFFCYLPAETQVTPPAESHRHGPRNPSSSPHPSLGRSRGSGPNHPTHLPGKRAPN